MNAREQYQQTYRQCRIQRKPSLNFNDLKHVPANIRNAAYQASKSYFNGKHGRDTIETMQLRLNNAKARLVIRRRNEVYFTQKHAVKF